MSVYLIAVILGVVEGLTEFLPVSSTGHLILAGRLLHFGGEAAKSFEIFIQLGAILAVAFLYRAKIVGMLRNWRELRPASGGLTLGHIAVAMAPAVVLGLLLHSVIKHRLFAPHFALIGLVVGGVFLIVAEKLRPKPRSVDVDQVSYGQALAIGLFQCLSLWPGFSRSGATIAGGLLAGTNHRAAADFSFILAVPMMAAATGLDLYKSLPDLSRSDIGPFAVGFVTAFLVAWFAVVYFLKLLDRLKLTPFAWYRFVIAALYAFWLFR